MMNFKTTRALGSTIGCQTQDIVAIIPEIRSISTEVECSPKQRQYELERIKKSKSGM